MGGGEEGREGGREGERERERESVCVYMQVEINPTLGCSKQAALTVEMALAIISSALGSRIL